MTQSRESLCRKRLHGVPQSYRADKHRTAFGEGNLRRVPLVLKFPLGSVSIAGVQGELIDVDKPSHHAAHHHKDEYQKNDKG